MFRKKRVLCYVLVFDQVEIIKKCLTFLTQYADQLDIVVIENKSANSPEIKRFIQGLGKKKLIKRYYFFNKNITSNAAVKVFDEELSLIKKSAYTIITDGDLTSEDKGWLEEEKSILKRHHDVFACGISLDLSNLPIKTYPESPGWIPDDKSVQPDYYETLTGGHLMMLRGKVFGEYIDWKNKTNTVHIDGTMHNYCYDTIHKKWARTKNSKAYHLTWDLYADKNHPYTKFRAKKNFSETWKHSDSADYTLTDYS